jgi:hypothetical protein
MDTGAGLRCIIDMDSDETGKVFLYQWEKNQVYTDRLPVFCPAGAYSKM